MTVTDFSPVPRYVDLLRLDGRPFLVVGAGQGIGRQVAHALAAAGAGLVCADIDGDRAKQVAGEVDGIPFVGDARSRDDVERMVATTCDELGGMAGLVDIVGVMGMAPLLEMSDDLWSEQFAILLQHAFLLTQAAGRVLRDRGDGGSLVYIASPSGLRGAPRHVAYGAAKAALMSMVRTAAVELAPFRIRANAVAPGLTLTPRMEAILDDAGRAAQEANIPLGRLARPADIAAAVLFLASDLAAFVTGQTLIVDGGVEAKFPYPLPDP